MCLGVFGHTSQLQSGGSFQRFRHNIKGKVHATATWKFSILQFHLRVQMGVSKNSGTPKSSILIGFSIINHPFWSNWGTSIFGNTQTDSVQKWKIVFEKMFCLLSKGDEKIECWWFCFSRQDSRFRIPESSGLGSFGCLCSTYGSRCHHWGMMTDIEEKVVYKPTNEKWWLDFQGIYIYTYTYILYITVYVFQYIYMCIFTQNIQCILIPRTRTLWKFNASKQKSVRL